MSNQIELNVQRRERMGKNESRRLRREGLVPAVLYGEKKEAIHVAVETKAVQRILNSEKGVNTVVDLTLADTGKSRPVMIKDYQTDPVHDRVIHCDFIRIVADHAVTIGVEIQLRGVAKGVKDQGGFLDHTLREIEVRCLPRDIPAAIQVDVSHLALDDVLHVSDIALPPGVEPLTDLARTICTVHAPKLEKEAEELEAEDAEMAAEMSAEAAAEAGEGGEAGEGEGESAAGGDAGGSDEGESKE